MQDTNQSTGDRRADSRWKNRTNLRDLISADDPALSRAASAAEYDRVVLTCSNRQCNLQFRAIASRLAARVVCPKCGESITPSGNGSSPVPPPPSVPGAPDYAAGNFLAPSNTPINCPQQLDAEEAASVRKEAKRKAAEEKSRQLAEAEAHRKAEEAARVRKEAERKAAEEKARQLAEAEAHRKAEEAARVRKEAERKAAEEKTRQLAEAEAHRKAEEAASVRKKAERQRRLRRRHVSWPKRRPTTKRRRWRASRRKPSARRPNYLSQEKDASSPRSLPDC